MAPSVPKSGRWRNRVRHERWWQVTCHRREGIYVLDNRLPLRALFVPRTSWLPSLLAAWLMLVMASPITGTPHVDAAETNLKGVDVSHWNGRVNWSAARDDGVRFVI